MSATPIDPRYRSPPRPVGWGTVLAGGALSTAVPVLFWAASNPLLGTAVATTAAGLLAGLWRLATARERGVREDAPSHPVPRTP